MNMVNIEITEDRIVLTDFKRRSEQEEIYFLIKDLLESLYG
jgi:hypothetical protein